MNDNLASVIIITFIAFLVTICIVVGIIGNAQITKTKECKTVPAVQIAYCVDHS